MTANQHTCAKHLLSDFSSFASLVDELGFMPLSRARIEFPSLEALTGESAWHTGLDTDPWRWKTRIVDEGRGAYAKLFGGKPGFVSLEWYPTMLAARRRGEDFEDFYRAGLLSRAAKMIYLLFDENPVLATHEIKGLGGFRRENRTEYEAAMIELQMNMFITVQGMTRITGRNGEPHSWPATSYTTVEQWAGPEMVEESRRMDPETAVDRLVERVLSVSPGVDPRKALRFVCPS